MSIGAIISFSIFVLLLLSIFKKGTDIFSPARLFALVWSFAIGLAELKLSWYQYEWCAYSWIVLMISMFSMLLGVFVIYVINFNKPLFSIKEIRNELKNNTMNSDLLFKIIIGLFSAYIISYIAIYAIIGYIPLFTAQPNIARTKWSVFGFGLVIHLAPTIMYLISLFFLSGKKLLIRKLFIMGILFVTLISFLFLLQRFPLIIPIILLVVFLYYGTTKFRPRNILLILGVFLLFMFGLSTLRVSSLFIQFFYYTSKMKFGLDYAVFTEPYMYVVMNLENFAHAVEKLETFTYGNFSFDFILSLSGIKHPLLEYTNVNEYPHLVTSNFNTYSMFFTYYRDFGVMGVFIFPFIIGSIASHFYYKMRSNPNLNTISIYAIFVFVILFSFFIPMLSWLNFVLSLGTIVVATAFIVKHN